MAKHGSHHAELHELAAELTRPGRHRDADPPSGSGERPDRAREIEALVRELQGKLTDAAQDAEQLIAAHPLAAVASALLLGIAIGRMTGRR